jgi:hypothetical protein
MADQTITPVVGVKNDDVEIAAANYAALTAANDGIMTVPKDGKYVLHFKVTDAGGATILVKAGGGILSSQGDMSTGALVQNKEGIIVLESARFKALSGDDKGKIRIDVDGTVSMACIQVP